MITRELMDAAVLEREGDEILVYGQKVYIYALCEPDTGIVRYVGKTQCGLQKRLNEHLCKARNNYNHSHRDNWIRSVLNRGAEPTQIVLDVVDFDRWKAAERFWIALYRTVGADLTNWAPGGEGSGAGEESPVSSLTNAQVVEMRERFARHENGAALAREFGISRQSLQDVVTGWTWRTADGPLHVPSKPLTSVQVDEIRELARGGMQMQAIGDLYGRSDSQIQVLTSDIAKPDFRLGERHRSARLTDAIVTDLRLRAASGEHLNSLVDGLDVARTVVHRAVTGATWKHVSTPPVPHLSREFGVRAGERNGAAKLTEADVVMIRKTMTADIKAAPILAKQFGVSSTCIWKAATGRTWRQVSHPVVLLSSSSCFDSSAVGTPGAI